MTNLAYKGIGEPDSGEAALQLVEETIEQRGTLAVDTETVTVKDRTMIGVGVAVPGHQVYTPMDSPFVKKVLGWIADSRYTKVYHNAMFDLGVLDYFGMDYNLPQPDLHNIADTALMAQVQGLPAGLQELAYKLLAKDILAISDILPKRKTMLDVDVEVTAAKCMEDVKTTLELYCRFGGPKWQEQDSHTWEPVIDYNFGVDFDYSHPHTVSPKMKDCYKVDLNLMPILIRMGKRGIALRQDKVEEWYTRLSYECLELEQVCGKEGFNPASNQQVGYMLALRGTVLPLTKSHRQLKVDKEMLETVNDPLASVVLQWREKSKLLTTYITPWRGQERAHTHYRLDLSTGRLASFDRNVQNIPPAVREIFSPDSLVWTDSDASQIEMRVFAYLSQDPTMLKAYRDGEDIHWITQKVLWPSSEQKDDSFRKPSKTFNFQMIFDASVKELARKARLPQSMCAAHRTSWLELYPGGRDWMEAQKELEGPWVESAFGRRMRLPTVPQFTQDHIRKCKINYPVQGTAADIIKRAMLLCDQTGYDMVAQVHDEILFDGVVVLPDSLSRIHPDIYTPFETKYGPVWD